MQLHASALLDKLKHCQKALSLSELQLTTSQKVVLWSLGVVGTSAVVVGILSRYLARRRAKPILNPRIQRAINKRISRMRSPSGGMGSVASSGGRSSPLGFSERLSQASGSIGSGGGDAAPLSPQQLGVMENEVDIDALQLLDDVQVRALIPTIVPQAKFKKALSGWKESLGKYWFEWRHKSRKKANDARRFEDNPHGGPSRFAPLNDLEVRVLALSGSNLVRSKSKPIKELENMLADNSDSDPIGHHSPEPIKAEPLQVHKVHKTRSSTKGSAPTGMEALETSINYWEDALAAFSLGARGGVSGTLALTSPEEAEFCREIQDLLQNAYMLQERCELLFLDQRSVLFRSESGGGGDAGSGAGAGAGAGAGRRSRLLSTHTGSSHTRRDHHSSAESFASAEDQVADLREFDDLKDDLPEVENLELYQIGVRQLEIGIPYRTLRTDVVQCASDSEFLCKLHGLRLALQAVFRAPANWAWFVDAGRQVLTDLLLYADKEPKEFLVAYEEMVTWTSDPANWVTIESELSSKGVKVLSFYDVVLDYILLDAFEDLESPPSSVLAVVRNRWLSDGFKESALTTAVWSVIKAKRRYLQFPDGFMAHFYSISEHLLPVLVWGFLGPHERLRAMCQTFKAEIVGYIADLFSFQRSRYTSVDELADDVMLHARARAAAITDKLADRA